MILLFILHIRYYTGSGKPFFLYPFIFINQRTLKIASVNKQNERGERGLINIYKSIISLCRLHIILQNVTCTEKITIAHERLSEF